MLNVSSEVHLDTIFCCLLISQKTENTHTNYLFQISILDFSYYKKLSLYMITYDGRSYEPCHITRPKTDTIEKDQF